LDTLSTGLTVLVVTLLASLGFCAVRVDLRPENRPERGELGDEAVPLGTFPAGRAPGKTVTNVDLANDVCITSVIFPRCPLSCPRIFPPPPPPTNGVVKELQGKLGDSGSVS